ncbi:hypothetical protein PS723_06621 [Pseudomonas fluorescens]|uniref:Uncharacterized protein n=1 Tax=Pseudomonas fluorescens TaxID=294 RepID=A0A5E7G1B6_PSEFL|nr:hypothetical protein PS723_06621 [Pseudomonas fluorescens]
MGIGFGNQTVEDRIGKDLPPLAYIGLSTLLAGLLECRAVPVFDPGLAWRLEIRSQAHTATEAQSPYQEYPHQG